MTAIDVCYCVLILSGAFALVSLGILLLRSSTTVKQVGNTVEMAQSTINKADKIMDDITYKLDLLNAPVETIARFFDPNRTKFNPISAIIGSTSYTHLRAHETVLDLVCRLLLEKKN